MSGDDGRRTTDDGRRTTRASAGHSSFELDRDGHVGRFHRHRHRELSARIALVMSLRRAAELACDFHFSCVFSHSRWQIPQLPSK